MMEYWVLGKWITGLLAKTLLTGKLINGKLPFEISIPLFQHSIIPDARQKPMPQ
jgi:hypothetical protein